MMMMKHWVKQVEQVVVVVVVKMCVVKVMSKLVVLEVVYDVEENVLVSFDDGDDDEGYVDVGFVLANQENNKPIQQQMKMMANT